MSKPKTINIKKGVMEIFPGGKGKRPYIKIRMDHDDYEEQGRALVRLLAQEVEQKKEIVTELMLSWKLK